MAPTLRGSSLWEMLTARSREASSRLGSPAGPLAESAHLFSSVSLARRDDYEGPDPSKGVLDPHDINNVGFFVLFALIGLGFVLTGIWFFFWAKNGGFHFKETDWDEYKSTVLRRKGPNGTLLSGATPTTDLGGGSAYRDVADHDVEEEGGGDDYDTSERYNRHTYQDDEGRTVMTATTAITGITAGPSEPDKREARKRRKEMREREKRRRAEDKSRREKEKQPRSGRYVGDEGVEDDEAEREAKKELRSYRHERAARVGGINKDAEGSQWDGSTTTHTNPTDSVVSGSHASDSLLLNKQDTPTKSGIRKVYSTTERVEAERLRNEAREQRRREHRRREESKTRSAAREREAAADQKRREEASKAERRERRHRRAESSKGGGRATGRAASRARSPEGAGKAALTAAAAPAGTVRREFSFQTGPEAAESALSESLLESSNAGTSDLGTKSYHHPMPELRAQRQREREERRARRGGYSRGRGEDEDVD
ncbi:hypothetical protein GMORB2_1661 [Geosmithia morbida]|uniref:Uncharacterized protein n=1 Tax=Geosmithia morbida TaxID=1094350 RepID=A0A9P4YRK9_9HYPO|nr:uncharacterized protein GMORB2_1661 [Geosmithia morbida]KAF4121821.1 hypothetical protein GMORB2_1661 [Geosmithia morbida]